MRNDFVGTMPMQQKQAFEVERLAAYLRGHIAGFDGPLTVEQFKGGQSNPTFLLSAGDARYVLRRKPPGKLLPSAHAVDREYRVITALRDSAVPVARTYCLCEDDGVIGTPFYVMEYVAGRVLWEGDLPGFGVAERGAVYDEMNRVIAALHRVDPQAVGLADYGKPGNYFERQIARWSRQYRASETERIDAMERLIAWLPAHIPPGEETAIVHGDFRLDNLIFAADAPRLIAVLDWELSTLGHPLADFSYHMLPWYLRPDEFRGLVGFDLPALGIPSAEDYLARYCQRTGRVVEPEAWRFYLAYNLFRLAAILQGIMARAVDGTASSQHAQTTGARARVVAEAGWRQVERIGHAG
ncbi:phosphotransferase [Thauera linaloolentis]|uniref:Aminoglycoside phosphotransferase n=1 Tax=Thauera linaloolentis (strain DSM 12138 / JCM 21573 / CCUG 41526 / CIP 105981 / IAM 15112 / NBRC 102519 / 47Lol) TaxID=1123367 RepID=N6XZS3_THAL4|nr:phosphotransferase [Thauera linaloolentis]ENO87351.1 aminoglycoside phosphotransferase [Thauera linaloolentis 47Lol = DSM 12138]MCM8565465.1 phosphotransferase [Thauera linaloolentis]